MKKAQQPFKLPYGTLRDLSKKLGMDKSYLHTVVYGRRSSPRKAEIFNALADYLAERKEAERQAIERLSSLLNN